MRLRLPYKTKFTLILLWGLTSTLLDNWMFSEQGQCAITDLLSSSLLIRETKFHSMLMLLIVCSYISLDAVVLAWTQGFTRMRYNI